MAWLMYADDYNGNLPPNCNEGGADTSPSWVNGIESFAPYNLDNINVTNLINSLLGPYCGRQVGIYHCPADKYTALELGGQKLRLRSISMNGYLEGGAYIGIKTSSPDASIWYDGHYRAYNKLSDLTSPTPSELFVFVDEHPDSINDGWFMTDMTNPSQYEDLPASYHNRACGFSYADGHAAPHKWRENGTCQGVTQPQTSINSWSVEQNSRDIAWLMQHATVKR
jgi:hypothetical protein